MCAGVEHQTKKSRTDHGPPRTGRIPIVEMILRWEQHTTIRTLLHEQPAAVGAAADASDNDCDSTQLSGPGMLDSEPEDTGRHEWRPRSGSTG